VGCKGPQTFSPCPIFQWNMKTSWPIGAGHPCIGCTEPYFWDTMTPFYQRLPDVSGWGIERNIDRVGVTLAGLTLAGIGAHATYTAVDKMRRKKELPVVTEPRNNPRGGEAHNG
jgi:hydrogenase small subunit